jgi:hypothetical protein
MAINGHHDLFGDAGAGFDRRQARPQIDITLAPPVDPVRVDMARGVRREQRYGRIGGWLRSSAITRGL